MTLGGAGRQPSVLGRERAGPAPGRRRPERERRDSADRATLLGIADSLVDVEGYEGERDALLSFVAWLDGDAPSAAQRFALAAAAFERRGFPFSTAVDLWALARIRPLGLEWQDALREVDAGLGQAGATWLRSQLAGRTAGLVPAP